MIYCVVFRKRWAGRFPASMKVQVGRSHRLHTNPAHFTSHVPGDLRPCYFSPSNNVNLLLLYVRSRGAVVLIRSFMPEKHTLQTVHFLAGQFSHVRTIPVSPFGTQVEAVRANCRQVGILLRRHASARLVREPPRKCFIGLPPTGQHASQIIARIERLPKTTRAATYMMSSVQYSKS